jgi:hypothetical protein
MKPSGNHYGCRFVFLKTHGCVLPNHSSLFVWKSNRRFNLYKRADANKREIWIFLAQHFCTYIYKSWGIFLCVSFSLSSLYRQSLNFFSAEKGAYGRHLSEYLLFLLFLLLLLIRASQSFDCFYLHNIFTHWKQAIYRYSWTYIW